VVFVEDGLEQPLAEAMIPWDGGRNGMTDSGRGGVSWGITATVVVVEMVVVMAMGDGSELGGHLLQNTQDKVGP
jgi:hypothetical protein